MSLGRQYIQEQIVKAVAHRLQVAVTFAGLNVKKRFFQKRMGKGSASVLARSEPGQPDVLRIGFVPPIPSLLRHETVCNSIGGR